MWVVLEHTFYECNCSTLEDFEVEAVFDSEEKAKLWAEENIGDNRNEDGMYECPLMIWWSVYSIPLNPENTGSVSSADAGTKQLQYLRAKRG